MNTYYDDNAGDGGLQSEFDGESNANRTESTDTLSEQRDDYNALPIDPPKYIGAEDTKEYPEAPFGYRFNEQEQVGLNTGALNLTVRDFSLPGKNGFDFSVTRRYCSQNANPREITPGYDSQPRYTWSFKGYINYHSGGKIEQWSGTINYELDSRKAYFINEEYARDDAEHVLEKFLRSPGSFMKDDWLEKYEIIDSSASGRTIKVSKASGIKYHLSTDTRPNNHELTTFGLGYGWSFGFPSIEATGINQTRTNIIFHYFLHMGDGRAFKLGKYSDEKGYELEGHKLKDLKLTRTNSYPKDYTLTYKDGRTALFRQEEENRQVRLTALCDRFGNQIRFSYPAEGGMVITDSADCVVRLEKESLGPNHWVLTWKLPDASTTCYTVKDNLLVEVRDQLGRVTGYSYETKSVPKSYVGPEFADVEIEIEYKLINEIAHPSGAKTRYGYYAISKMETPGVQIPGGGSGGGSGDGWGITPINPGGGGSGGNGGDVEVGTIGPGGGESGGNGGNVEVATTNPGGDVEVATTNPGGDNGGSGGNVEVATTNPGGDIGGKGGGAGGVYVPDNPVYVEGKNYSAISAASLRSTNVTIDTGNSSYIAGTITPVGGSGGTDNVPPGFLSAYI